MNSPRRETPATFYARTNGGTCHRCGSGLTEKLTEGGEDIAFSCDYCGICIPILPGETLDDALLSWRARRGGPSCPIGGKRGRPRTFVEEHRLRVIHALRAGASQAQAAEYAGTRAQNLTYWLNKDDKFHKDCQLAKSDAHRLGLSPDTWRRHRGRIPNIARQIERAIEDANKTITPDERLEEAIESRILRVCSDEEFAERHNRTWNNRDRRNPT